MSDENKLIETIDSVKNNFEYEEKMRILREQVSKKFNEYRTTLNYMAADAPIGTLCLPLVIENALLAHGCLRIYDLFNLNFTEVKGLGVRRVEELTSSLDKFFSML